MSGQLAIVLENIKLHYIKAESSPVTEIKLNIKFRSVSYCCFDVKKKLVLKPFSATFYPSPINI